MKKMILAISLLLSISLTYCGNNNKTANNLIVLDIESAIDNKQFFDLNEIANEIEFVPLDSSGKESLIGNINAMRESMSDFYILNTPVEPIKVFDKMGKFKSTRGTTGRGPNEFTFVEGMAIDFSKDNTYVMARENGIIVYDSAGRVFTRKDSVSSGKIAYYDNQLFLLNRRLFDNTPSNSVNKVTLLEVFSPELHRQGTIDVTYKGNAEAVVGSIETGISVTLVGQFISDNGNSLLVKEGRNDTVFVYKNEMMLEPAYKLEFGNYSSPAEMFEGITQLEEWKEYYSVEQMYEGDRYIVAEVVNGAFGARSFLVFDSREPQGGFMATGGTNGMPGIFIGGIKFTPCYIRDNRLVGYMQAIDIVDNAESITNPELKALAATLKEDSNPVIVVAKLKK